MRYAKHGTTLLAVLMVAIMGLSVFAMPVAASGLSQQSDVTVDAVDDIGSSDYEVTGESFNITVNEQINNGDEIKIQLDSGNTVEGDFELTNVGSVVDDAGNNVNATASISNEDVYATTDDTITVTLDNTYDAGTNSNVQLNVTSVSYEINEGVSTKASTYTDTAILTGTNKGDIDVSENNAAKLTVEPGEPDSLKYTDTPDNLAFDAGSDSVTVKAEDAENNEITATSFKGNIQDSYSNDLNLSAELLNSSGNSVDIADEGDTRINLSSETSDETATFSIDSDGADGSDINDLVVGDALDVEVSETGNNYSVGTVSDPVVIEPDQIAVSSDNSTSINADVASSGTAISHTLQNNNANTIADSNIDNITLDFDDDGGDELSPASLSAGGNTIVSSGSSSGSASVTQGDVTLTLTTSDNGVDDLELRSSVVDASTTGKTSAINILSGEPAVVTFSESDNANKSLNLGTTTVTAQVEDSHGNVIDDRDFGTTQVQLTLTNAENIADRSTTTSISLDNDGDKDITFVKDGPGADQIEAAVGTFDIEITQTNPSPVTSNLPTDTLNSITFYPAASIKSQPSSPVDPGVTQTNDVTLNITDTSVSNVDLNSDNVDQIDVDTVFQAEHLQGDRGTSAINANINQNGRTPTLQLTDTTTQIDWNSTTAGEFNVSFDAVPSVSADETDVDTTTFEVRAGELDASQSTVSFNKSFAGTITDPTDTQVTVQLRDQYNNYLGYTSNNDNVDTGDIDLDVADQQIEDNLYLAATGVGTNVEDADGEITYNLTSTDLNDDTSTGAADVNITDTALDPSVTVTTQLDLVHEAFALNEGANRLSVPQPANVHYENLGQGGTFTTWNTSEGATDSSLVDLSGTAGDSELHRGIFALSNTQNARIGYDFETSEQVDVGEATLKPGWNFVGTNYDISDSAETGSITFDEDLLTVDSIGNDANGDTLVYDGGVGQQQDSTTSIDGNVDDNILSGSGLTKGELGTYWVYVEDSSSLDDNTREIVGSEYTPDDRDGAK